jgi:radical SAM superfamily enzyme YgiQ (UPF0313 family)
MRYTGRVYRPPSEAHSYILQATIGCSWNNCTYCDMYRDKPIFRTRPLSESLEDIAMAGMEHGPSVEKVFVADGDALIMPMDHWRPILEAAADTFSGLRSVSCYATATNILEKTEAELRELVSLGLGLLYIGPESGDEGTMRRIAKGPRPTGAQRSDDYLFDAHVAAAQKAKSAGFKISTIFLLGAGGVERSDAHAHGSARLVTEMDPDFLSALTLTVVPGTPLHRTRDNAGWVLPDVPRLLEELRIIVDESRPTNALFRTNHASNYLPLGGRLPMDRKRIVDTLDLALSGDIPLRPEWSRGL